LRQVALAGPQVRPDVDAVGHRNGPVGFHQVDELAHRPAPRSAIFLGLPVHLVPPSGANTPIPGISSVAASAPCAEGADAAPPLPAAAAGTQSGYSPASSSSTPGAWS